MSTFEPTESTEIQLKIVLKIAKMSQTFLHLFPHEIYKNLAKCCKKSTRKVANPIFDSNCLYVLKCLALVFVAAPCVLFAGGMLICLLLWCGLRITRALHLRLLGLPRCGRCRYWATVQCPLYGRNTPSDFCSRGEK